MDDNIEELVKRSIDEKSVLNKNTFTSKFLYNNYIEQLFIKGDKDIKIAIIKDVPRKILNYIEAVQDYVYSLSIKERHSILGYELYEVIEGDLSKLAFKLPNSRNRVEDIRYRVDLAQHMMKIGELNSVLDLDFYKKYIEANKSDLRIQEVVVNKDDISYFSKMGSNLLFTYLLELSDDTSKLLILELYRYLTFSTTIDNVILLMSIVDSVLHRDLSNYFYFLYTHNKITLSDIDKRIKHDVKMLFYITLQLIFRDVITNDGDITAILELIDKYDKTIAYVNLIPAVVEVGDKKWIKWLINRWGMKSNYKTDFMSKHIWTMIYQAKDIGFDMIIDVLVEIRYDVLDMITNGNVGYLHNSVSNILARSVDIKRLIEVYNNGESTNEFRRWFEQVIVNQV